MASIEPAHPLGFTARWVDLGVVSTDELASLTAEFRSGDDPNTEHYRWRAFRGYLERNRPLPPETAVALYDLGADDADVSMGLTMMTEILELRECPAELLERASASGDRHLVRTAHVTRMIAQLRHDITDELFSAILEGGDSRLQHALLDQPSLTAEQLTQLAQSGRNRAIRNIAAARLRRKRDSINQA